MTDFFLSEINIYPIKSAAGISLKEAEVVDRGLKYDRRWMLVDSNGKLISQRTIPQLALLSVKIENDGLIVSHKLKNYGNLYIPFEVDEEFIAEVEIWEDKCKAVFVGNSADCWFSKVLKMDCRLVFMPDSEKRLVDEKYSSGKETVGFADGFPFLLTGRTSLADLNSKLINKLSMNRFRPNLVFKGGNPFVEDTWKSFSIGAVTFYSVKPCSRCVITTIDQETGVKGKEPLNVLSTYRKVGNKVLFGQNLIHEGKGRIKVGDRLIIHE